MIMKARRALTYVMRTCPPAHRSAGLVLKISLILTYLYVREDQRNLDDRGSGWYGGAHV